jgi:hypothetical protein
VFSGASFMERKHSLDKWCLKAQETILTILQS